ncbi:MAG: AEC family transporter [Lachnospiraceae bacterium]|nr:AEC family transporter [Lachnospiraceae bacterium]
MENLVFSLNVTLPIFLTIVIGYVLKQVKMLDGNFVKILNKFNFNITLPALIFLDLYEADFYEVWDTKYVLFCFFVTLICIAVIFGLTLLFGKDKSLTGEFVQAAYRGSAAVLGLAFIQNIYGSATIAPLMIIGSVPLYNVLAVVILSFTRPGTQKLDKKELLKSLKGVITNPVLIGIALGLIASLTRIEIPAIAEKTLSNLAVLATPLALIGLGAGFEGKAALSLLKPTLLASFIRLVAQCAIFLPLAVHFGFTGEKMISLLVMLGAPTTPSCYIMAKNMGHEGHLTSSVIVTTTLLSSVTLTFWLFLLKSYGLI